MGLLRLGARVFMMVRATAAITWDFANILNAHFACKQCNGQEKTHNEHGNRHEHPGYGFEATIAECLEDACANTTYDEPPDHCMNITNDQMI
jgi:hypothetical protein